MEHAPKGKGLPTNAYTELAPGETYEPIVAADKLIPEVTVRSVVFGVIMSAVFTGAAAYLGLKVGQVFEAAIPIAIIAVGMTGVFARRSTLLENVIIQSIGAASGVVVAGAIFTLPALFILGLQEMTSYIQVFVVSLLGGAMGILFLIPLRRYFVRDMHGKLPFPEATATTEILVAGEAGGNQAFVLAISAAIGGLYDFAASAFGLFKETFSTSFIEFMSPITNKVKGVLEINVTSAVLGLGYIIGLKYALIILAGSLLSYWVIVPLVAHLDPATYGPMDAYSVFKASARNIGIGGIFMAGLIGIAKSLPVMVSAFSLGFKQIFGKGDGENEETARTDRDLPMSLVLGLLLLGVIGVFLFFRFDILAGESGATGLAFLALAVVFVIAFLFTTVAAQAIAIVGTNPVSGMTLMTLIVGSLILVAAGLKGDTGSLAILLIGGVVCTALSMSGGFVTDLKIGYWLGSTPSRQEGWKFLGTIVAAATVGGVIIMLDQAFGYEGANGQWVSGFSTEQLAAPQANAMAAVIQAIMSGEAPILMFSVGAVIAIILEMLRVPPLPFALGMYIPLQYNTPLVIGALIAYLLQKNARNEDVAKQRRERGTLIASGFIAGGALMGLVAAILKFLKVDSALQTGIHEHDWANLISIGMLGLLCVYVYWDSTRTKD